MPRLLISSMDEIADVLQSFQQIDHKVKNEDVLDSIQQGINIRVEWVIDSGKSRDLNWAAFYANMGAMMLDFMGPMFDQVLFCDLLLKKHALYGLEPLLRWKHIGILQRLDTKMARIKSLLKNPQSDAGDETLEDTYTDIIGYCVLGYLLRTKEKV